jgi:serine/threonine kinase PknH
MGVVYLAFTPGGRAVALKVLRPELGDDPGFRARFRQEIEAARRVHGLYTAPLLDADPEASPPWLAVWYVAGPSLAQAVEAHGPLPEATVLLLVAGVAEALLLIHSAGLVHRDLKPSNVLLAADGPRVIDFGIARAVGATELTRSGMVVGSPRYMSPEQVRGEAAGPPADVWALAAIAAFAATGRPPFGADSAPAVLYRVLEAEPDLAGCPPAVAAVIGPCLARDPAARPSPAQLILSCQAARAGQVLTLAEGWLPPELAADLPGHAVVTPLPAVPAQNAPARTAPEPSGPATAALAGRPPAAGPGPMALAADLQPPVPVAQPGSLRRAASGKRRVPAASLAPGTRAPTGRRGPSRTMVIAAAAALVLLVAVAGYSLGVLPDPFGHPVNGDSQAAETGADGHGQEPGTGSTGVGSGPANSKNPGSRGPGADRNDHGAIGTRVTGHGATPGSGGSPAAPRTLDPCLVGTWEVTEGNIAVWRTYEGTAYEIWPEFADNESDERYTKTISSNGSFTDTYHVLDFWDYKVGLWLDATGTITGSEATSGGQELNTYTSEPASFVLSKYGTNWSQTTVGGISGNASYTCSATTLTETIPGVQTDTLVRKT